MTRLLAGAAAPAALDNGAAVSETHSAVVFFAGDRAYKLKKPVNLGFLDFSTPQAREAACHRETELNRRFAPDVYLGVAEIRDPAGQPCDHLVVMRRLPADRRLAALVRSGSPVEEPVRRVARILATQHALAHRDPEIARQGFRDALWQRWKDNFAQIRQLPPGLVDASVIDEAEHLADRFLGHRDPLFAGRVRAARIVDGHGDLLADDIFCLDDGPRILDCLDFDDRLRWVDGLDDAAFLAMDLERLGAPQLAERFIRWYAEYSGDPAPTSLLHHYTAYRSLVRAKVDFLRALQGDPEAGAVARQLLGMTLKHLRAAAVTLVMIGGLPGTGKSALSAVVAGRLGFTVLSSDEIRKELAGVSPGEHHPAAYGAGLYAPSWTGRTYREMLYRASKLLRAGESVILDASWISAECRALAAAAAEDTAADLVQLRCLAPLTVTTKRMQHRTGISDANPDIAARMEADQEPWPDVITIDTASGTLTTPAGEPGTPAQQALNAIRPHGPEHTWRPTRPYMLPD
jgi:aminoglycoside phosphotransferase family enzyme/predicted kinase